MSNLPVYPMGQPPPSPGQARALVDAQNVALHSVLTDLIGGMYDATDQQSRAVGSVAGTLSRSLAGRVAAQGRALAAPAGALGQHLTSGLEAQRALLAPAQVAAAQAQAPLTAPRPPAAGPGRSTNPYVPGGALPPGVPVYYPGGPSAGYIPGMAPPAGAPAGPGGLVPGPPPGAPPGSSTTSYDPSLLNPACPPPINWPGNVHYACDEGTGPVPTGPAGPTPQLPTPPRPQPPPPTPQAPPPDLAPDEPGGSESPLPDLSAPATVPVTLPPPLDCTILLPVGFAGGIPLPGSQAWCDGFEDTRQLFITIGRAVVQWAVGDGSNDILAQVNTPATQSGQPPTSGVGAVGGALLGLTPGVPGDVVRRTIQCWAQALNATGLCEVDGIIALAALKALLGLLGQVRVGWDLIVWFTVDLHLPVHMFDEVIDQFLASMCPAEIPSVPEAVECLLLGTAPEPQVRCWMLMRGASLDVWLPVVRARRERLTPEESIEWDRRNDVPEEDTLDGLRRLGMYDISDRRARLDLYDELPTIQDHLHWLQRNVFDVDYVRDYNLMEGFADRFWVKFGHDLRAQGLKEEYAALHYAAHWIQPAPGQLAEMLQRLRPGRVSPDVQFTETDYLRLLAEQDVAPYFRARMRAVAYAPFGLRFLRQIYDTGGISDAELGERLQDLGYSPADAHVLALSEGVRRAKTRATQARGWTIPRAVAGARSGLLTPDEGFARVEGQGWTRKEWDDALGAADVDARGKVQLHAEAAAQKAALAAVLGCYADGVCGRDQAEQALVAQGWTRELAAVRLDALDLEARRRLVKEGVGAIRSAYRAGRLGAGDALVQLQQLGLQPGRAAAQVSVWEARQTDHRKHLTGKEILGMLEAGLLSVDQARARLTTLGYADPDALLLLREADLAVRKTQAKALAAADKQRAAQIRAQERAVREAQTIKDKAQAKLKRLTPIAKLTKWLSRGIASEGYVRDRMSAMGYPPDVIDEYIQEAGLPPKKSGKATPANGQAGTPPAPAPGP
jgi:hypothetical protein